MDQNSMMGGMPMPQGRNSSMANGQAPVNPTMSSPMGVSSNMPNNPTMPNPVSMNSGAPLTNPAMPNNGPMMPGVANVPGVGPAIAPTGMPDTARADAARATKSSSGMEIAILVAVCIIAAAAIVAAVYFFMQWNSLKTDFDSRLATDISKAVSEQQALDEESYIQEQKEPFASFTGPLDYGSVYMEYPKTWNVYEASDGSNNSDYEAYFSAGMVPMLDSEDSRYALRFIIRNQSLDSVQQEYDSLVEDGEVTSQSFSANNVSGTLFTGMIGEKIDGSVLLAKINDKTLILQTDSTEHFGEDFAKILAKLRRS